ncbi:hypothetical protein [Cellulomonas sp. Leaf334]|uniref:hypothetical protein n=1 Tax=Cellulomonas sp. Leaf334 TaxID=1736339 RepID=UPI0006FF8C18|nr:hypothetical protein [Cellulomonas sp. Leaf334]KQR07194.1 hypothetical protein ASF78_21755 [Cellulomonas sp. Leaf334]
MATRGHQVQAEARCDPGGRGRGVSAWRVVGGLAGLALLVAGVLVAPDLVDVVPAVAIAVGAALVVLCLLPWVSTVEIIPPLLAKIALDPDRPRRRTFEVAETYRALLLPSAGFLCSDEESAARAVDVSIAEATAYWRGNDDGALRVYLLCVLVHQARFEAATHPRPPADTHPARVLSRPEREALLLAERLRLDHSVAAAVLGVTVDDVRLNLSRALAALDLQGQTL